MLMSKTEITKVPTSQNLSRQHQLVHDEVITFFIRLKLAGQSYKSSSSRKRRSTLTSDQIATNTFEAFTYNYLTNLMNGQAYIGSVSVSDSGSK